MSGLSIVLAWFSDKNKFLIVILVKAAEPRQLVEEKVNAIASFNFDRHVF